MTLHRLRQATKSRLEAVARPLARLLLRWSVTPNTITLVALALSLASAGLILAEQPLAAGVVLFVGGALDLLDGTLARLGHQESRMGAFLDSTLDRVAEGVVYAALAAVFAGAGLALEAGLTVLALLAATLVSYTRARAEGLGAACEVGLATRGERVLLLIAGLVSGLIAEALAIILAVSAITVGQRIHATARHLAANP
ncbi:CDP-diacylglycerol--glycerol-3-phosphate 3-phosphatidyltransferase [Limimonas halophila]|uniref:CDP-diacylglycerol--glycerol-3-phosphate 3-phosphatidyltransferase n=1 Tax=Limimonas halophila TaxID=1082479 RepID=A0A1G7UBS4_9PROT|nr:CDP-alcohol phosphatidyltransferase family protein [Limimonas halophila]SDG44907.1 CDP-diacylglycerol--glycerol-3-phosphate 3-phosphatidyltransferase [Limimonas halophila]